MSTILLPREASCRLSGEAELGYVNYDARDNNQHISANSLTQHYSVMYDTYGKFVSGRLGRYNVALGYEWLTFDTGIKSSAARSENLGKDSGHLFYKGEVDLDPKEVPFRLFLYSHDLNKGTFVTDTSLDVLKSNTQGGNIIAPYGYGGVSGTQLYNNVPSNVATGILGGTRIDSGATLVAGVKNGMTNGYNEILRHFPMLMLDYRDQINKDKGGFYPVDNRLSRLAFVSLNKKDNWFHYRYVTYNDNIDSSNNYNETQIQLGTVDHKLQRRWIDFSNWLNVSVDGQLTKRMQARSEENYEEFSLNLFGTARRQSWELRTFNNFTRLNEVNNDVITYATSLPVYANGIISPTVNWSAYTKYNNNHTDKGVYFTTVTGGYNIDAFRKSVFTLSQGLGVEQVTASGSSDSLILTGNVGTSSTPQFSRNLSLKAAYNIRNSLTNNINGKATNFIDQEIKGTANYNLTNKLLITVGQTNRFTAGTSSTIDSSISGAAINSSQYVSPRSNIEAGKSSYQSITDLKIAWNPKPRLNFGFSASEDIYAPASGVQNNITKVGANADYSDSRLKISSKISYNSGGTNNDSLANQLGSTNSVSYIYSRSLDAKAGLSYFRTFGAKNRIDTFAAEQSLNYNYYLIDGVSRKLFEINESFTSVEEYTDNSITTVTTATKQRSNSLQLGAKYYPLRQMLISGGARYSFVNSFENAAINYYGSLSLRYQLLEASLDYTYGKNKTDNRVEKRLSANIKKKF